jgi:hypothetical protein
MGTGRKEHVALSGQGQLYRLDQALAMEYAMSESPSTPLPRVHYTLMLRVSPVKLEAISGASSIRRPGKPEDIATTCSYLVSAAAGSPTG